MQRTILIIIGWLAVVLGTLGVVLPLLPTTPFILLAAFAAALLPAGRRMVFHQTFNIVDQHPVVRSEPSMLSPEEVTPFGITASTEPALQPDVAVPIHTQATTLSHLAAGFPARFSEVSPAPLYIRPPDAKPQSSLL